MHCYHKLKIGENLCDNMYIYICFVNDHETCIFTVIILSREQTNLYIIFNYLYIRL